MSQRPLFVLLAVQVFLACGQVSELGQGRDDQGPHTAGMGGQSRIGGAGKNPGAGSGRAGMNDDAGSTGSDGGNGNGGRDMGVNGAGSGGRDPGITGSGLCTREGSVCFNNQLYACESVGKGASFIKSCEIGCGDDSSCAKVPLCTPKAERCVDTQVSRCNASGTAWLAATDCPAGSLCSDGGCKNTSCDPGRWYCRDQNVYRCNLKGEFGPVYLACDPDSERCVERDENTYAFCTDGCTPGTQLCVDGYNGFGTCNADHSRPTADQATFCAFNELCKAGKCEVQKCWSYCKDSQMYRCADDGLLACGDGEICQDFLDGSFSYGVTCATPRCAAGTSACIGNQVGSCAADGKGLVRVTSDCKADGNVCTVDGQCAKTVTDTLGVAENNEVQFADNLLANLIRVDSPRKLTELQMWLTLLGPRQLRWIVYEQVGHAFVAKADKVASTPAVNGAFVSSGAGSFNVQLQAGKAYLFGVMVSDGESTNAYDFEPYVETLSFGIVRGRVSNYYFGTSFDLDTFENSNAYIQQQAVALMRVVTEAP